jgi:hypothetical protein
VRAVVRAGRFPEWQSPQVPKEASGFYDEPCRSVVDRSESDGPQAQHARELPRRTFTYLKDFVGHDDAARLTKSDVIGFPT